MSSVTVLHQLATTNGWFYVDNETINVIEKPSLLKRIWYLISGNENTSLVKVNEALSKFLRTIDATKLTDQDREDIGKLKGKVEVLKGKITAKFRDGSLIYEFFQGRYNTTFRETSAQLTRLTQKPSADSPADKPPPPDVTWEQQLPSKVVNYYKAHLLQFKIFVPNTDLLTDFLNNYFRENIIHLQSHPEKTTAREDLEELKAIIKYLECIATHDKDLLRQQHRSLQACISQQAILALTRPNVTSPSMLLGATHTTRVPRVPGIVKGCVNATGSDCFLISLLQVLATNFSDIIRAEFDDEPEATKELRALLRNIIGKINDPKQPPVTREEMTALRSKMKVLGIVAGTSGQEDIEETYTHLLNVLNRELRTAPDGTPIRHDPGKIYFSLEKQVRVEDARHVLLDAAELDPPPAEQVTGILPHDRIRHHHYHPLPSLSIDLTARSLSEYLRVLQYTGFVNRPISEHARTARNRYTWNKDHDGEVVRIMEEREICRFTELPTRFTLSTKRFCISDDGLSRRKIDTPFTCEPEITLVDKEGRTKKYKLVAFAIHRGTATFGHYLAMRFTEGMWHECNDGSSIAYGNPEASAEENYSLVTRDPYFQDLASSGYLYTYVECDE